MLDAEIHRERMKPHNIYANIGRDAWDYANDRVIGTGKGWNYNLVAENAGTRVGGVDDSLARETMPQREVSFAQSPEEQANQTLTETNVVNYANFNADREVLKKEFGLSKGLLDQAAGNINSDYFKKLSDHTSDTPEDLNAVNVFLDLVNYLNGSEFESYTSWAEATAKMDDQLAEKAKNLPSKIEDREYNKNAINDLKERFKDRSDDQNDLLHHIKEYLCEAFCLIEIIEELGTVNIQDQTRVTDVQTPGDTNMFSFGTPARETTGFETFISPITGQSVKVVKTPYDLEKTRGTVQISGGDQTSKTLYTSYPAKSPNERLIDMKNSTWKTKETVHHQGRVDMRNKVLYNVGPREAYVVDRTFDGDLNFLGLGELSHDGELIIKRRPEKEYFVEATYDGEHQNSESKVTHAMRRDLFKHMDQEHQDIMSSPAKYRRGPL